MNITTLEQAASHLISVGAVNMQTMQVEGRQLLEACGYSTTNAKARLDEQVAKHKFDINKDFTISIVRDGNVRRNEYAFTLNAANHVLLASMTEQGKVARQEAIEDKYNSNYNRRSPTGYDANYGRVSQGPPSTSGKG